MTAKKLILIFFILSLGLCQYGFSANRTDLLGSYREALQHDPLFQIATSERLSISEGANIALAGLLPNIGAQAGATFSHQNRGNPSKNGTVAEYSLNLKQPLFDYGKWINYQASKDTVRAANANYGASLQDLIVRLSNAYFAVSQAEQNLRLSEADSTILKKRLHQTKLLFKAGINKTADLDNARAAYDSSRAQIIHNKNRLTVTKAILGAIVGMPHPSVAIIKNSFSLISPQPKNLNAWLVAVKNKNLAVLAARYSTLAAEKNIAEQHAGHYPVLDATASFSGNHSKNNGIRTTSSHSANIGATLILPIYQGGLVMAQTQQAQYDYQTSMAKEMNAYQNAMSQAQQAYSTIISNIDAIRMDRRAIASNQRSYKSTVLAYHVGTRNMMDLLTAQQSLFSEKRAFLNDKYQYLESFILLKEAAGTLSIADVELINRSGMTP